ncbi:MAG: hypothetical protein HYY24_20630 [Verrucomicrobia bacterium]|nr:hypothetical protein [Verrucomicrobiota bacterium]
MIERVFPTGGLSLIPTLSRWERENWRRRRLQSRRPLVNDDWLTISLSQRERVGVRERPSFLRTHWASSRNFFVAVPGCSGKAATGFVLHQANPSAKLAAPMNPELAQSNRAHVEEFHCARLEIR